jgi:gliding motility-associated-like protein
MSFLRITRIFACQAMLLLFSLQLLAQPCTELGQTPATAFPVCGTTVFHQASVPICSTNNLFVPGCTGDGADYENKNPFFYKFTCFVSGTLGFLITPLAANEDYDWQLYDITGRNPNEIFTNNSLIVTGNWSGSYGPTGASASGVNFIQCASVPSDGAPTFAAMPALIAGHQYLLMISHYTNTQSGYDLSFGGGTGVITDPAIPHMQQIKTSCDGLMIGLKLNKNIRCNSLTGSGTEFSISPAAATVTLATTTTCSAGFDFDSVTLTLSNALPNGNYQLVINNGSDGNTLRDYCDNSIPVNERLDFSYFSPQPIFADSIGRLGCAPDSLRLYFPKKISCASIAANGSDFSITGPSPVTIVSAGGNCVNGKTDYVVIRFASPIVVGGTYQLTLIAGNDGTTVIDECGQESPTQTLSFTTADTVSATFQYTTALGCLSNNLTFTHDGAHNVNNWNWTFNNAVTATTQSHNITFPASSSNTVQLIVSNGICRDTVTRDIVFDNETKAAFTMPDIICPEDGLEVTNNSSGQIDAWRWNFDVLSTSTLENPPPFFFPTLNREAYYTVKLVVTNNTLGCTDSTTRRVTVLDHCYIDVATAFTPNNDGINDYFSPHNAIKADNYEFKIFNRWGQLVFQSNNWRDHWDGKIKGVPQGTGVFVWMLSYTHRVSQQKVFKKGTVTLIR